MKLLIAYDGSDCSNAAIEDLRRAGLTADTKAVVMTVAEPAAPTAMTSVGMPDVWAAQTSSIATCEAGTRIAYALVAAHRVAEDGARRVSSRLLAWTVGTEVGAPERGACFPLVRKAEQWPADIVVIGSHGRSALGRLVLGSVSQQVLAHAPCAVRIGRCPEGEAISAARPDGPARVFLAYDGSPESEAAVDAVIARAWPAGTKVRVATAVDLKGASLMAGFGLDRCEGGDPLCVLRRRAQEAARRLSEAGLRADAAVVEGAPQRVLVEVAERWAADCIFLGARGHGLLERLTLGSVSAAIAARAHCSVEVVRSR